MKRVALEGPINACTDDECNFWRETAMRLLGKRFTFHNPMDFDCRGKESELEKELVDFDTKGIASSDIVLVMANKPGWGTAMAVQMAFDRGKRIIAVCDAERPSPWLKDRCDIISKDLHCACQYILDECGS
jgi:hypothetical protein